MKKIIIIAMISLLISSLLADKYAGEIFRLRAGVRNYALGNTGVTDKNSTALAVRNPALIPYNSNNSFEFMHAEEYDGMLKYDTFSFNGNGNLPFSAVVTRIGINDIPITKLENEDEDVSASNKPFVDRYVNNSDYILYFGYGRVVNEKLSIGVTPKIAYRDLAGETGYGFGLDLGLLYQFNKNLFGGLKINDAFTTQIIWADADNELVVPSVDLEFSYENVFNRKGLYGVKLIGMSEIITDFPEDDITAQIGDLGLDFHAGIEYAPIENLQVLMGYDVDNITAGLGFQLNNYMLTYAYEHELEEDLDNSHRISAGVRF